MQVDTDADTDNLDSEDQDDDEGNWWTSFMYSACFFTKGFTYIGMKYLFREAIKYKCFGMCLCTTIF